MASMREIKRRKESIQNTGQITAAMKVVSTAKLHNNRAAISKMLKYTKVKRPLAMVFSRVDAGIVR